MSDYHDPHGQITQNLVKMQERFRQIEERFIQLNEYFPYDHNPWNIYSPKLSSMLADIGPQILGMFELIRQQLQIQPNGDHFSNYYNGLNHNQMLSTQFLLLQNNQKRNPFEFSTDVPTWWQAYNQVKHHQPDGEYQGTLENTIDALGALYILHHIADAIQRKKNPIIEKEDITNSTNWLPVLTIGNYIHFKTKTSLESSLYETFSSRVFSVGKRFLPHLKGKNVEPYYRKS